jgi:uncharacterized protein YbjQ (UPF0145 family)
MVELIITAALLILALFTGRYFEARHYSSIQRREAHFLQQPAVTGALFDADFEIARSELVVGSVVVSIDYFKQFIAGWQILTGGELSTYSPLLDRGRREAILRMKEQSPHADLYSNCRLETSRISSGQGKNIGTVEVMAYATAITYGRVIDPEALDVNEPIGKSDPMKVETEVQDMIAELNQRAEK